MAETPAFHIPLSADELKALGELVAIHGQIEYLMEEMTRLALAVNVETARKILGSAGAKTNSDVWIAIIREKCAKRPNALAAAEAAFALMPEISQHRNELIHAIFVSQFPGGIYIGTQPDPNMGKAVARRFKPRTITAATEIAGRRDKAAIASVAMREAWVAFLDGT